MIHRHGENFFSQAAWLGVLSVISTAIGFVRDILIVHKFGAGNATDAYLVALSIPTVLFALFVGSGLNVTVVPSLVTLLVTDRQTATRAFSEFLSASLVVGGAGSLLIFLFAKPLVRLLAPGLHASSLAISYLGGMSVLFFLMVTAYVLASFHSARQVAGLLGLIGSIQNLVLVLAVLLLAWLGSVVLVIGTVMGALAAMGVQAALLRKAGFREPLVSPLKADYGWKMFYSMLPFALAFGIGGDYGTNQVEILLTRFFASGLDPGSITLLALGNRFLAPVVWIGSAIGGALLPAISVVFHSNDEDRAASMLLRALTVVIILTTPALVIYWDASHDIIRLLFGHRSLTPGQVETLSSILRNYTGAIIGTALTYVLGRALAAMNRNGALIRYGVITVIMEAILMPLLLRYRGAPGIATAISLGSLLYAVFLGAIVLRHFGRRVASVLLKRTAMISIGATAMFLIIRSTHGALWLGGGRSPQNAALSVGVGLFVYAAWVLASRNQLGVGQMLRRFGV